MTHKKRLTFSTEQKLECSRLMGNLVTLLIAICFLGTTTASGVTLPFNGFCKTIQSDFRAEAQRLFAQSRAFPEPGRQFNLHNSVKDYLSDSPPLDPSSPNFHIGNALMWQETIMKTFAVSSGVASSDFQQLSQLFYGKDDMLMRPSGSMAAIRKELELLGPKNRYDHFVLDYILLVLSDHFEYTRVADRLLSFCKELSKSIPPNISRKKIIVQQISSDISKLRALAYRPKFSLKDTPRILAMANVFALVAQSAGAAE